MESSPRISVVIPAYNEEKSVGKVVSAIPKSIVHEVIVVNNNSTDNTSEVATKAGATVLDQPKMGYGNACLKGLDYIRKNSPTDIVVFLDADFSDFPEEINRVVDPILQEEMDMVIGSRVTGNREKGSLTPQQVFGNWLATVLIRYIYKVNYTDLGPFRAIKWEALESLNMIDKTYGWTVEMQVKAAKKKLKTKEVSVSYRNRIGVSKVSGTLKGTILAGYKIITTIFRYL